MQDDFFQIPDPARFATTPPAEPEVEYTIPAIEGSIKENKAALQRKALGVVKDILEGRYEGTEEVKQMALTMYKMKTDEEEEDVKTKDSKILDLIMNPKKFKERFSESSHDYT